MTKITNSQKFFIFIIFKGHICWSRLKSVRLETKSKTESLTSETNTMTKTKQSRSRDQESNTDIYTVSANCQ